MRLFVGVVVGLLVQIANTVLFDANRAEGVITYLLGVIVGTIIYDNSKGAK